MKGRIIGREGRNIRTLEHLTGVDIIIDDTPQAVVLSSFDGIRREIARLTLGKLIEDGRIQPARIEEMYYQSKAEIEDHIRAGRRAGRLRGERRRVPPGAREDPRPPPLPDELRPERPQAHARGRAPGGDHGRRAGRRRPHCQAGGAAPRPRQGAHTRDRGIACADLGRVREALRRVGGGRPRDRRAPLRDPAADGGGGPRRRRRRDLGSRPGARGDTLENYIKRLEALEEIAARKNGVEKVYALQAGREIRVIVKPGEIDDDGAVLLSHEIAREIETELEYPGQIKVTVIRESRATELAKYDSRKPPVGRTAPSSCGQFSRAAFAAGVGSAPGGNVIRTKRRLVVRGLVRRELGVEVHDVVDWVLVVKQALVAEQDLVEHLRVPLEDVRVALVRRQRLDQRRQARRPRGCRSSPRTRSR